MLAKVPMFCQINGMADPNEKPAPDKPKSYWQESKRPLVCLAFVAPMLLIYEGGVLLLGPEAIRNGVEVYLRYVLQSIGFGQYLLLPVLTTSILLAWHHINGDRWQIRTNVLGWMLAESLMLAFVLLLIARMQGSFFAAVAASTGGGTTADKIGLYIGYFGAGIYEELLFRLMLLPTVVAVIAYCGVGKPKSITIAVIVTSLVFSAAHYQLFTFNEMADLFSWFSFTYRFLAGVFFALLFLYRGFGVTVGAHALYDIFSRLNF